MVEGIARQTDRGADPASGALGSIPTGANIFKVKIKLKLKLKTQKSEIKLKKKEMTFFLVKIMCIVVRMCCLAYATVGQLSEQNTVP